MGYPIASYVWRPNTAEESTYGYWYLKDEYNNGEEDSEAMHASKVIPHMVVLLVGHPGPRHKDEEDYIHDLEHDHKTEDDENGHTILLADEIEVGEEEEHEVVVWADQATPGWNMLH